MGDVAAEVVMVVQEIRAYAPQRCTEGRCRAPNIYLHPLGIFSILMMTRMREIPLISFQSHLLHLHTHQAYILNTLYLGVLWKQLWNFSNYFLLPKWLRKLWIIPTAMLLSISLRAPTGPMHSQTVLGRTLC